MADAADRAQDHSDRELAASLKATLSRLQPASATCRDCGEPVEPGRFKLGLCHCLGCAQIRERGFR